MQPHDFWQEIHPPRTFERLPSDGHHGFFPAELDDGRQLRVTSVNECKFGCGLRWPLVSSPVG
jgi:hypothetical protein